MFDTATETTIGQQWCLSDLSSSEHSKRNPYVTFVCDMTHDVFILCDIIREEGTKDNEPYSLIKNVPVFRASLEKVSV